MRGDEQVMHLVTSLGLHPAESHVPANVDVQIDVDVDVNVDVDVHCLPDCNNATANDTSPAGYSTLQFITIATLLTILSLATTIGNLLVIVSIVVERNLRTVTNCFITSLAVADVTIGVISMPLFTAMILTGRWLFGPFLCDLWLSIDYTVSNASVANLIIITCDRYLNVTRPLTYRAKRTKRRAVMVIVVAWLVSALLWTPGIIGWQHVDGERALADDKCYVQFLLSSKVMTLVTAAMAFYVPVLIMLILYWKVYLATRNRDKELTKLRNKCDEPEPSSSLNPPDKWLHDASPKRSSRVSLLFDKQRKMTNGNLAPPARRSSRNRERANDAQIALRRPPSRAASALAPSRPDARNNDDGPVWVRRSQQFDPAAQSLLAPIADSTNTGSTLQVQSEAEAQCSRPASVRKVSTFPKTHKTSAYGPPPSRCSEGSMSTPRKRRIQVRSDAKAAKTISAVLLAFIVTWTPYNVFAVVRTFCGDCVADWIFDLGYLLCYINSTINPVCYAMCNENFRNAFKRILQCKCRRRPAQSALLALAINLARTTSAAAPQASLYAEPADGKELSTSVLD